MSTKETNTPAVEQTKAEPEPSDELEVIRGQIEETRAELGDTVEALAAKADVKAQVKHKVAAAKEQIKEKQEEATSKLAQARDKVGAVTPDQARAAAGSLPERIIERPLPVVVVAGLLLGWLIWKRR